MQLMHRAGGERQEQAHLQVFKLEGGVSKKNLSPHCFTQTNSPHRLK